MSYYAQISGYILKMEPEADGYVEIFIDKMAKSINAEAIDVFMTLQSMQENNLIQSDPKNGNRFKLLRKPAKIKMKNNTDRDDDDDILEDANAEKK